MQLNVPFSEIPEHGIEYEIKDTSWFPEEHLELAGPVLIHIRLTKKSDSRVEVKGNLQAAVLLECDRCLKQYVWQFASPMQFVVEVTDRDRHWKVHDIEPTDAELETIAVDKPVLELGELLREQLLLALPEKKLCREQCPGLCSSCGADLNEQQCGCAEQQAESPFAVLKRLKK